MAGLLHKNDERPVTAAELFPELATVRVAFDVVGVPRPQGSKQPFTPHGQDARPCPSCRRRHLVKMSVAEMAGDNLKLWRRQVAAAAHQAMAGKPPMGGPLHLDVGFTFARPKAHYRTGKFAHLLKDDALAWPAGDPDLDKLVRAVGDALKGKVWADDSQVVHLSAWECFDRDSPPCEGKLPHAGASIVVTQIA